MPHLDFSLKPFKLSPAISLMGQVVRDMDHLTLTYEIQGDVETIVVPEPTLSPSRQDNLWQTTCFECFFRPVVQAQYWEVNLSPSRCWNVYNFQDYRQDSQPDPAVQSLPVDIQRTPTSLQGEATLDLAQVGVAGQALSVAIATVVHFKSGQLTYWALTHPAAEPDFHHRDSFVMTI